MTVRVERVVDIPAPPADVWAFIDDPEKRARPISVLDSFETTGERTATWHLSLPVPGIDRTIAVETEDVAVDPPNYVKFVGRSRVMNVQGEHVLDAIDGGTRLTNRFVVEGRIPGLEAFFERRLDDELENLAMAIREDLGL